jgi:hypothetical protein
MRKSLVLCALLLTSCANLAIHRNDAPAAGGERTEVRLASFLFGFVPGKKLPPVSTICGKNRLESIDLGMTGNDVLLTLVTFGIYVPHRAVVTCGK